MPRAAETPETPATRRIHERLGDPIDVIRGPGSARTMIYEVNARPWAEPPLMTPNGQVDEARASLEPMCGPGTIDVRLSGRELQGGQTYGSQFLDCWEMAVRNRLPVSRVIICLDYRSELRWEERWDFADVREQLALGACHWVAFREPDRVARRMQVAYTFYEELQDAGTELWFASLDRAVDWDSDADVLQVAFSQAFGQAEARKIARRLVTAKRRAWADEGKGWPAAQRFGFRRDASGFLEVDPQQWWVIKFVTEKYAEAVELQTECARNGQKRKSGTEVLSDWLAEHGVSLSGERIRGILHDTIYNDGRYVICVGDELVEPEAIPIPESERIPLELIQANIELMACQKGPHCRTKVGTFCLNGIKVIHEACAEHVNEETGWPPLLKGRNYSKRPSYYHVGKGPCNGYTLARDVLEPPVIRALWDLADDPDVQAAWAAAMRPAAGSSPPIINQQTAKSLREAIANLEGEQARLTRELLNKVSGGAKAGAGEQILLDQLAEEIARKHDQLDLADRKARSKAKPKPLPGRGRDELREALHEILTEDVPENDRMRIRRMAVIECCLSQVRVRDRKDGDLELILKGPLAPKDAIEAGADLPISPLDAAQHILVAHLDASDEKQGGGVADGAGEEIDSAAEAGPANDAPEPLPGAGDRISVHSRKYIPPHKFRLRRRYWEDARLSDAEHKRRRRRYQDPWPGYFDGFRGDPIPVWASDPIHVPVEKSRRITEAEAISELLRAAKTLPPTELITEPTYQRLRNQDQSLPTIGTMRRMAASRGMTFTEWRFASLPEPWCGRPAGGWTLDKGREALRRAYRQLGDPLNHERYGELIKESRVFPSASWLNQIAARHGLTFGELCAEVVAESRAL